MVAGALAQIIYSKGYQDLYLSLIPQLTYFKSVYRRHTNFAIETCEMGFDTNPDFGKHTKIKIKKYGDLLSQIYLHVKVGTMNSEYYDTIKNICNIKHETCETCYCYDCLETELKENLKYGWINSFGHAIIENVTIDIGGQRIDRHYGEWLEIWSELTMGTAKQNAYYEMIGKIRPNAFTASTFTDELDIYVPLQFWFCQDYGLALPLVSIPYHDIEISFNFRNFESCWLKINPTVSDPIKPKFYATLLIDYIFLDLEERERFIRNSHQYLITQIQMQEDIIQNELTKNIDFYFNNPVRELFWTFQLANINQTKDWFNYSTNLNRDNFPNQDLFDNISIQINGIDRIDKMSAKYYRILTKLKNYQVIPDNFIYTYPFCLNSEKNKPNGTINFSNISNSKLIINMTKSNIYKIKIYAKSFNILMITGGMAAVLF